MNASYKITETLEHDGLEYSSTRYITEAELMEQREPGTDWNRIGDLVRCADLRLADGGRIYIPRKNAFVKKNFNEIGEKKQSIIAFLEARKEIAEARIAEERKADEDMAGHDAFASAFYASDSDL